MECDTQGKKYHCLNCGKYFNDLTKTIFENHKFPIEEMFYILKENKPADIRGARNTVLAFVRERDWREDRGGRVIQGR